MPSLVRKHHLFDPAPAVSLLTSPAADDAYFTDQIFVGLISAAVAWPIRNILQRLFEKANERDDEVLEAWLVAPSQFWVNALFGPSPHRLWHFTGKNPVSSLMRWMTRYPSDTAAGDEAEAAAQRVSACFEPPEPEPEPVTKKKKHRGGRPLSRNSALSRASSSSAALQQIARQRRFASLLGFIGIYVAWAICVWFIFVRSSCLHARFCA